MDQTAIEKIQKTAHIPELIEFLKTVKTDTPIAFVPDGFTMKDIEDKQEFLTHYRMNYSTNSIDDFISYVNDKSMEGTACFVDGEKMKAHCIIDLGTPEFPLHKLHNASLSLDKTAEYLALERLNSSTFSQQDMSDFLEDWELNIQVTSKQDEKMTAASAAAAFRNLTIESARTLNSQVHDYGSSLSAMEKIDAKTAGQQPAQFTFSCQPFDGLSQYNFRVRFSILTSGERPRILTRIIQFEKVQQEIEQEFKSLIDTSVDKADVFLGVVK